MKAGIVIQNDYPHDGEVRPRKMAKCLDRAGHRASIISWNAGASAKKEDIGYAIVYRFGYFLNSRLYRWLSSPSPVNAFWAAWIASVARREHLDVLIASNIRIAPSTILAAKFLKIPIVLDLQENNPEVVKLRGKTSPMHYITRNSKLISLLERLCIKLSNHTWVVVEERLEDLGRQGIEKGKISIIDNVPDLEAVKVLQDPDLRNETFTLIYVGGVARLRGLDLIVESMPYILEQDEGVRFLIVGDGDDRSRLEDLVRDLEIEEHVAFVGWVKSKEVPSWIMKGDVGVIPHQVNQFTNTTIPNKLFDYMAVGIPVLATNMKPVRRIIEQEQCGVIIPSNSSHRDVADIILRLKNYPEERVRMGTRGRKAVLARYNWDIESKKILSCLEKIMAKKEQRI
jgi:glycosyltransferase involved in cell wall biosynthesis